MKSILAVLVILISLSLNAQSANLRGQIIDKDSRTAISYVNIGVVGKNIGTVSDGNGFFSLTVPREFMSDTMRVSMIGYKSLNYTVADLQKSLEQDEHIRMEEAKILIPNIVISESSLKSRILGNKNATRNVTLGFSTDTLGNEMAIRCKVRRKQSIIKNFNVKIADNPYDTLKFRVNIYNMRNGLPGDIINTQPIYTTTTIKEGMMTVDLSPYNIVTDRDFFVSLEWIEDLTHLASESHTGLNFGVSLFGKPVYHRTTSHGYWKKLSALGATMNVEVLQ